MDTDYHIPPFMRVGSAIGNAYFSDVGLREVFSAVDMAKDDAEFDAAVEASVRLQDIIKSRRKN